MSCVAVEEVTAKPANTSIFQVLLGVIVVTGLPPARSTVEKKTSEFLCKFRDAIFYSP
jgi:hypothetical protein